MLAMFVPRRQFLLVFGIVVTILGGGLRVAGARGDLWLDEIHTLMLIQSIHRADEVFWHINHDNNHFLTTLYLFLIGPDHSSIVLRLESIVLGTLAIPAAGLAAYAHDRRDMTAAAAAMLLCATVYPAVHYGSEARGYTGLVLFSFLAIHCIEGGLTTARRQVLLGGITLLGILSHMLMIFVIMGLMLWRLSVTWRPGKDLFETGLGIARAFWASIAGGVLVFLCIKLGALHHSFIRGGNMPSTPGEFIVGLDTFYRFFFGVPLFLPLLPGLALSFAVWAIYLRSRRGHSKERLYLYTLFFTTYPAWLILSHANDLHHPRYYLPLLAPLILMTADCVSAGLHGCCSARLGTISLVVALCVSTLCELSLFYAGGRGDYSHAVVAMTHDGPATFTSDVVYGHSEIVEFYAGRLGVTATFIPQKDVCVVPPDWLIHSSLVDPVPDRIELGRTVCNLTYVRRQVFPVWGLSGWQWTLYRRLTLNSQR